jgi:uncharacterized cupredoxin-like copper-binding protein
MRHGVIAFSAAAVSGFGVVGLAFSAGDLSQQKPFEIRVELGTANNDLVFLPNDLSFETGKLYKLVLHNPSTRPHYFTSPGFEARIYTRKVQVMTSPEADAKPLGEIKGAIREVEAHPGGTVEWWFVPVATGTLEDLRCTVKDPDGKTHAEKGMTGKIVIK